MSTFKMAEPKRAYIRTATALATKSVPTPMSTENSQESSTFLDTHEIPRMSTPELPPSVTVIRSQKPSSASNCTTTGVSSTEGMKVVKGKKESESEAKTRPNLSFAALIVMALESFPDKRATLQMIYSFLQEKFPYFREVDSNQWQNSIRHNLSLQKAFVRSHKKDGKGHFWSLSEDVDTDYLFRKKPFKEESEKKLPAKARKLREESTDQSCPTTSSTPTPTEVEEEETDETDERRRSLEDFLKKGLGGEDLHSTEALIASPRRQTAEVQSSTATVAKTQAQTESIMGSMDYYEQYDPDKVAQNGQGVVTTGSVPVEALCFLCGSAGREPLLFCVSCCEGYHPYCLQQEELPQTAELEREWTCARCSLCQVTLDRI